MISRTSDPDTNDDESTLQQVKQALLKVKEIATVSISSFDPRSSYGAGFPCLDRSKFSGKQSWSSGLFGCEKSRNLKSPSKQGEGEHEFYRDEIEISLRPGETPWHEGFRSVYPRALQAGSNNSRNEAKALAFQEFNKKPLTVLVIGLCSVKARERLAEELKRFAASLNRHPKLRKSLIELAIAITTSGLEPLSPSVKHVTPLLNSLLKDLEIELIDLRLSHGLGGKKPPKRNGAWLPKAIALMQSEPNLPDCHIAEAVGVHPGTVSKNAAYKTARKQVALEAKIASVIPTAPRKGRRRAN